MVGCLQANGGPRGEDGGLSRGLPQGLPGPEARGAEVERTRRMPVVVASEMTVDDFLHGVLAGAYRAGLHRVPAKYASDTHLLLHSMMTLLVADELIGSLGARAPKARAMLAERKEEIWLTAFLHDILKEAGAHGERIDHQDVRPDDVSAWLERLDIGLVGTSPLRLAARIAMHERAGLLLLSAFGDVEEDDLPQLVVRLSDQLASLSAINEHWYYPDHGLPRMRDTLNGRGRLQGINQRLRALGAEEPLALLSHYHTRVTHPYLTNQVLAGTVASLRELGLEPLLVLADGVVYLGSERQCALAEQQAADVSELGLGCKVVHHAWGRIAGAIAAKPLRPEDIRATQNGMKIFAQMRLLGTPLSREVGSLRTVGTYLSQRVQTRAFSALPRAKKGPRVGKFIADAVKLVGALPKYYAGILQVGERRLPVLKLEGEQVSFAEFVERSSCPPEEIRRRVREVTDPRRPMNNPPISGPWAR